MLNGEVTESQRRGEESIAPYPIHPESPQRPVVLRTCSFKREMSSGVSDSVCAPAYVHQAQAHRNQKHTKSTSDGTGEAVRH